MKRNINKLLALLLSLTMLLTLAACGGSDSSETGDSPVSSANSHLNLSGKEIGVLMPDKGTTRWAKDGELLQQKLESLGAEVQLEYADNDTQTQIDQITSMISNKVDCLVIAAVDASKLTSVADSAAEAEIPIIAYDRLIVNTENVSYFVTCDSRAVGTVMGEYIKTKFDLEAAQSRGDSYTCELFMGAPNDSNALMLYNGIMDVLGDYFKDGTLEVRSGKTAFEDTCILEWSQDQAQQRCETYLSSYYQDKGLDICLTAYDEFAYGCKTALEEAGFTQRNWPVITGQDAEITAIQDILAGTQTMSVFKDAGELSEQCISMIGALLADGEAEINAPKDYNNGVKTVPAYVCTPVAVDESNYERLLVDSGYYSAEQFAVEEEE
jgi:putative multiple sugar transport system substrate-binding protein